MIIQSLCECKVTPISKWCLDRTIGYTKVLPPAREGTVSDSDLETVERVVDTRVKIESLLIYQGKNLLLGICG